MSQTKNLSVEINGNKLKIIDLVLDQSARNHHKFEINVSGAHIGDSDGFITADEIYELVGRVIQIKISDNEKADYKFDFEGYVAEVRLTQYKGDHDAVTLIGYSPTKVADDRYNIATFTDSTIEDMAKKALSSISKVLKVDIPSDPTINYCTQYNETGFQFIARLAAKYGLWFYYEGKKLILGEYHEINTIKLKTGVTLNETNFAMRMIPINQSYSHYDYLTHERLELNHADTKIPKADKFFNTTIEASQGMCNAENNRPFTEIFAKEKDIKDFAENQVGIRASQMMKLYGRSENPGIHIGTKIEITGKDDSTVGSYYVTSVKHECDGQGHYSNIFKAIPAQLKVPIPSKLVRIPKASQQIAAVVANDDPEGLGRLQVQFPWQDKNEKTPWIRYVFPYAGEETDSFWLPELEDQVLVGFEFNNPDRPIVLGSLYHGQRKPQYTNEKNTTKAFQTKCGHKILFEDGDDSQISIITKDDKNKIVLNVNGDGEITLETPGVMELKAKSFNMEGEELSVKMSKTIKLEASQDLDVKGANVNVNADAAIEMKGSDFMAEGSASAGVKGGQVDVEASGIANIKGAMINLN